MPTIWVIADWTYFTIDASEVYWKLNSLARWSGDYFTNYDMTSGCADASEAWHLQRAELTNMLQDSIDMAQAIASVQNQQCERQNDGKKTCIDLFIASNKLMLVGDGDGRTFDSTAGYLASRAQIYLDFERGEGVYYLSPTTVTLPYSDTRGVNPYPHEPKAVRMTRRLDGSMVVEYHIYNGFCRIGAGTICPSIDGYIEFYKQSDGVWRPGDIARDEYPSLHILLEGADGIFRTQVQSSEGSARSLFTRGRTIARWRQEMQLPAGCQVQ